MDIKAGSLLSAINSPNDLRKLDTKMLPQLCQELRNFIVDQVSVYGGHFGASLGVVELTVALHYVFNTPRDQLVWDVGHQAYGHKILTGRRDVFHTNRKYHGISGFPKRSESEYDAFGVGHSSTSISAVLGMAEASRQKNDDRQHIAVIGDGAMTGGMAFEAMNHAGVSKSNLLIVLNDNCMSIDPNVGALKDYLTNITTSQAFNKFRDEVWKLLGKINKFSPNAQQIASKVETSIKSFLLKQSNLFESLNIRYFGPIDGHDSQRLIDVFEHLKNIPGPKILHCLTVKGKGFLQAEKEQTKWHAPGTFDKITGSISTKTPSFSTPPKYQDVFGNTLVELAENNPLIIGITPAMPSGSSMKIMMDRFPDRSYDVGIAEQHSVTFSAGMATQGLIPFCNIYSSFMQRAYDQVIHDVCIQKLPVVFCMDRAGIAGADGATHHGAYDIAYMRCLPNMIVAAPLNEVELRNMMFSASLYKNGPFSIRYPRGNGVISNWKQSFQKIAIGKGKQIVRGNDVAILTIGHVGNFAIHASKKFEKTGISVAVYDMRFVKPLDTKLLHRVFKKFDRIITVEDGSLMGGFGSAIIEFASDNQYRATIKRLGIPDKFIEHGEQSELHKECGFDMDAIIKAIRQLTQ